MQIVAAGGCIDEARWKIDNRAKSIAQLIADTRGWKYRIKSCVGNRGSHCRDYLFCVSPGLLNGKLFGIYICLLYCCKGRGQPKAAFSRDGRIETKGAKVINKDTMKISAGSRRT